MGRKGRTEYTYVGDAAVAYQVIGDGPLDVVRLSSAVGSNVDLQWDLPPIARALDRLASFGRLITFDRRGVGVSDPVPLGVIGSWEHWMEDVLAVLEAAGSRRPAILAEFDACPVALLFAATYPDRVHSLVLWNGFARFEWAPDYPIGVSKEDHLALLDGLSEMWGTERLARATLPERTRTPGLVEALARFHRGAATPTRARTLFGFQSAMDGRDATTTITAPTFVLAREDFEMVPAAMGRFIAERIEGARFMSVPGSAADFWSDEDADDILDAIETFLTGSAPAAPADRVLATIVFTDLVGSTDRASALGDRQWRALLDVHDEIASQVVAEHHGRLVKGTGDGMLATFDGPGRAIGCIFSLRHRLAAHDLRIRAGVHAGEVELRRSGDIGGLAVHIAARVIANADPDEVLCSRTVRDLTVGSPVSFTDRGTHSLKGIPDAWQLFAAQEG